MFWELSRMAASLAPRKIVVKAMFSFENWELFGRMAGKFS